MPRTTIVNGQIVTVSDDTPRVPFQAFSGVGQRLGGNAVASRLLNVVAPPRRANTQSYTALRCPPTLRSQTGSEARYEMLLTIREYMNLTSFNEVLVFGASKEIEYPFLATPCRHITMVSTDNNDANDVLSRLRNCVQTVTVRSQGVSAKRTTLKLGTSDNVLPLTVKLWKLTYGEFKVVVPSKRYDCLIDKASWLYTDPAGWATYLDKLKVDGFLITDCDYSMEGTAPWLLELFGLHDVSDTVLRYYRQRQVGYGYDGDGARLYVKVKYVPPSLMQLGVEGMAKMDPLLKLYRYPRSNLVGAYLEWHKHRAQANVLRSIVNHARLLSRFRFGSMALRLERVHEQLTAWIDAKEQADRLAHEHYLED